MKQRIKDYWVTFWRLLRGRLTQVERELANERWNDVASHINFPQPWQVLDLANGRLRPQYYQLKSVDGLKVYGIDYVNAPQPARTDIENRLARWLYTRHQRLGKFLKDTSTLVCGDVGKLPYKNSSFHLITSIAAFEHFLDVRAVISEAHRVLCPDGVVWIRIHLFTCLSGAHNLSLTEIPLEHVPPGVDAWDHLRNRKQSITVPLNEWRLAEYISAFAEKFDILEHRCAGNEGQSLLTPELSAELSDYTQEELTCNAYVIVAQKRGES